ncbi:sulfite exporter TauE/SafE family protein [Halovulum dunhuangense]|uniref:Probable membrane transporter protein n=1 Tax=Halovulum dunhuangense TaxID=1505036 RepID=A0A849L5B1_9RHOB|nr:sulfite exporter TauE/SafE family protein [Halovulum dunhuangense]NNU81546.1 sulfite exporter TauE/SafE family protein [Halovulum dunhuangense]
MAELVAEFGAATVVAAFGVMLLAGFVKGAIGFALPIIAVSGIGALMSAELAIASILLPGLFTNLQQTLRDGVAAARETTLKYWRTNLLLVGLMGFFAQIVVMLPDQVLYLILGLLICAATALQLSGWRPHLSPGAVHRAEWGTGVVAAAFGGLTGVWGPPLVLYLLARDTPKAEMVRAQGIFFLLGSAVLIGAHLISGLLDTRSLPFSAWLIVPAFLGMILGQKVQDRLPQERFRKLTLIVLAILGLNLLRRGLGL